MNKSNFGVHFISITTDEAGQRIDNFLCTHFKGVPKSFIYRIVRKGEVRVNKKRVEPKYKLQDTDKVRIPPIHWSSIKQISVSTRLDKLAKLNDAILYEDNYLLALNKPAGIAVHGSSNIDFSVIESLRALRPNMRFLELVHRLDRDTSGVLLIAKKRSTLRALHEQLRANEIQKRYLALVRGQWQSCAKMVTAPLLKSILKTGKRIVQVNNKGKLSKTFFKVEEIFTMATLVSASPVTGRTHQVRVHAQYIGHPIALDNRYGDTKFNKQLTKYGLNRLFLHASTIRFYHPNRGKKLQIEAPLDSPLRQCLLYLRTFHK